MAGRPSQRCASSRSSLVDFPEEDVPELDDDHLHRVLSGVKEELDSLIRNYQADTILREGVDCAIVGRPNAGKSTLPHWPVQPPAARLPRSDP